MALFASVSVHVAYESLAGVSPLPLVGIVDATVDASAGHQRLGIFATSFTVRSDMFGSRLAHRNIKLVLPAQQEQDDIQCIYFDELVIGRVRSPSRQRLLEIAHRMRAEQLIDGVLLAAPNCP